MLIKRKATCLARSLLFFARSTRRDRLGDGRMAAERGPALRGGGQPRVGMAGVSETPGPGGLLGHDPVLAEQVVDVTASAFGGKQQPRGGCRNGDKGEAGIWQ
jgi:hypothetical protein